MESQTNKEILNKVLKSNFIMTLGTSVDGRPQLCTVFYVTENNKTLFFKSRTQSNHSKQFDKNPEAAASIYDPSSNYSTKSGIQTLGKVERVKRIEEMTKAVGLYVKAFKGSEKKFEAIPELLSDFVLSTMYKYTIEKFKVLDSSLNIHTEEYEIL